MKVTEIEWDEGNQAHFDEHARCSRSQVEDVLRAEANPSRAAVVAGGDDRYRFEGQTSTGRYLVVIAARVEKGRFRPITCWPLSDAQLQSYLGWRKTIRR